MANQPATPDELLHSQILTVEALIRVLEQDEIMAEVQRIQQELEEKRTRN